MTNISQQEAEKNVNDKCLEKNYTLINKFLYKNSNTKIHLKCNKDNHEWITRYRTYISKNHGCLKCANRLKLTQNEVEIIINNKCKELNYTLLDNFIYKNNKTKIHLKCNKDNYDWYTTYYNFINNNRHCKKCGGNLKKTLEK